MTKPKIALTDPAREMEFRARRKATQKRFQEKHKKEIRAKYNYNKEQIQADIKTKRLANLEEERRKDRSRVRVYTEEQKAHTRELARIRWAANPEKAREKTQKTAVWREKNKERDYARDRNYRRVNSDKVAVWRGISKERKLHRTWYKNNPDRYRAAAAKARARRINAPGYWTAEDINRIRAAQRGRCGMCGVPLKVKYHIDHITSLARGGSNWPRNLQLLCPPCNMEKHDSDPLDYARRKGRLL